MEIQIIRPQEIEARSMAIIQEELERLGELPPADRLPVIKRVIHTTADFDYRENLWFSDGAVQAGIQALRDGAWVVTDGMGGGPSALWPRKRSPRRQRNGGKPGLL